MTPYQGDLREVHDDAQALRERLVPKKDGDAPNEPLRQTLTMIVKLARVMARADQQIEKLTAGGWRETRLDMSGLNAIIAPKFAGESQRADRSRLETSLLNALLRLEWAGSREVGVVGAISAACLGCHRPFHQQEVNGTHVHDCYIDAALTFAGLPDQASRNAAREKK